jgi:hypothetical protein
MSQVFETELHQLDVMVFIVEMDAIKSMYRLNDGFMGFVVVSIRKVCGKPEFGWET